MQLGRAILFFAPLLILALFAPALIGIERLAFRDVSHFYTPLYDYVAARTADQWLPLWNPLDQTGIPLLGETTTAVLYPVRYLLFALPLPTEVAIAWYVVLHLILALFTARLAARWSGLSSPTSTLVGIIYALSGSVLFLYTNPPFLVGAGWLPLVLGVTLARQPIRVKSQVLIAAPAMSMMLLGGDPQTALHAMLVIGTFYLSRRLCQVETSLKLTTVIAIPTLAAVLSAPQLCASISWSRQSDRVTAFESQNWLAPPVPGSLRSESFQYSIPPWHTLELLTPNAFGWLFPIFSRIGQLIPGDGRMWTPTLYMGMVVLVAIGIALAKRQLWSIDRWRSVAFGSLLLAFGHFGLAMFVQTVIAIGANVDSAAGGFYWLLYNFLPGYDSFRYPAKWLPLFSLGVAVAVGNIFEQFRWKPISWRWFVFAILIFGTGIALLMLLRQNPDWVTGSVNRLPQDEFWGPLDLDRGLNQIQWSIIHSAIAVMAILSLTRVRISESYKMLALTTIVAIDLAVAGHSIVATVPIERERELVAQRSPPLLAQGTRMMRTQSGDGWPRVWKQTTDPNRMLDVEASLRISRFGRWHLGDRLGMFNNMVSIQSNEMAEFWRAVNDHTSRLNATQSYEFWRGLRRWLAIDGVLHQSLSAAATPDNGRVALLIEVEVQREPNTDSLRFIAQADETWAANTNDEDFGRRLRQLAKQLPGEQMSAEVTKTADQTRYRAITIENDGLLVRPVLQDGHWKAEFAPAGTTKWKAIDVLQVDRLTQGVLLPYGHWDVRFYYQPAWLFMSVIAAVLGWTALFVWWRNESAPVRSKNKPPY